MTEFEINTKLEKLGYSFVETVNLWESGLNFLFRKEKSGQKLHFKYYWDNQSGPEFMNGELSLYVDLHEVKYLSPNAHLEISPILFDNLDFMYLYEKMLIEGAERIIENKKHLKNCF